ncbi:hypothetical protein [Enhydrobacter sp.]|jgi:hypothetical protein|uniref:hypothetical protein n=1 Tax=Enhydrobacter sp. TaxID=1894999 RepID=UPI00260F9A44|nr:hypothetical protein [Enhydrobacter sp.]WIM12823.1 MAG: hypothetical protein OJF58_003786 [Enhydrobacter sp.]
MNDARLRLAVGVIACAVALLLAFVNARAALAGWLTGFAFWSGLPIGALGLLMMMRLIPGRWRDEFACPAESTLVLLPLAAIAALPILIGLAALYPWVHEARSGYRAVYLSPAFFVLRTVLFFVCLAALALLLVMRPARSVPVSSAGLIAYVILATTIAVDWLMSLDPEFHSSGFGLYVLADQMTIALAVLLVVRLTSARPSGQAGLLGGLFLCALLFWAYFAFMQYFIIWSNNLPASVAWYRRRGEGFWAAAEYAIATLHLGPTFLLFFPPVRNGVRWLLALAFVVLLGKALEMAWLVLPTVPDHETVAALAAIASLLGLGVLTAAMFAAAPLILERLGRREARAPS